MKKMHFTLPVLVLTLFSVISVLIALCPGVTIFYANGMNNYTKGDADRGRQALEKKLHDLLPADLDVDFQLAYNKYEGQVPQFVEVGAQKADDVWKSFWNWLSGIEVAPDWFQNTANDMVAAADAAHYVVDADLQDQVTAYNSALESGRQVIVVAHSQGNFYANAAYSLVNNPANFHIVAVASPAHYVADNGPHVTLPNDYVINGIVGLFSAGISPWLAPPLDSIDSPNNTDGNTDWKHHDFVSSYLEGDKTGKMITGEVKKLVGNPDTSECKADEEPTNPEPEPAQPEQPTPAPEPPTDTSITAGSGCGQEGVGIEVHMQNAACSDGAGSGRIYPADTPSFSMGNEVNIGLEKFMGDTLCYVTFRPHWYNDEKPGKYILVFFTFQLVKPLKGWPSPPYPSSLSYDVCGGNRIVFEGNQHSISGTPAEVILHDEFDVFKVEIPFELLP